jgi:hypothetical protein
MATPPRPQSGPRTGLGKFVTEATPPILYGVFRNKCILAEVDLTSRVLIQFTTKSIMEQKGFLSYMPRSLVGGKPQPVTPPGLDIDKIMDELTLQEKISFLSGTDNWHLYGVERLGIPAIRTSDGPNGVRGTKLFNGTPAACLPCGTALAATWDVNLVEHGGELQAKEAIAKGVSIILGPTVNMQRSPLVSHTSCQSPKTPMLTISLLHREVVVSSPTAKIPIFPV